MGEKTPSVVGRTNRSVAIAEGSHTPPVRGGEVPRAIDVPLTASVAESEIAIGARRYVGAARLAALLGVSLRTLSRWDARGTGPPKIKIGRKVVFDIGQIPEWLATRELPSTRGTGQR